MPHSPSYEKPLGQGMRCNSDPPSSTYLVVAGISLDTGPTLYPMASAIGGLFASRNNPFALNSAGGGYITHM